MSSERRKRSRPPAILKAGSPMPSASSSTSPASANTNRMSEPSSVPLMADSRFCFSEKPCVRAAKIGARPSGSMTTSRVTNALNTNSMGQDCTLYGGARIRDKAPLAAQRQGALHGLLADPYFRSSVPSAYLLRERPYNARHVRRQVPDAPGAERQAQEAVET